MSREESVPEELDLREVPGQMVSFAVDEWHSRTAWGKILYPVWFLNSALMWGVVLFFFGTLIAFHRYSRAVDASWDALKKSTPQTYKEGGGKRGE